MRISDKEVMYITNVIIIDSYINIPHHAVDC